MREGSLLGPFENAVAERALEHFRKEGQNVKTHLLHLIHKSGQQMDHDPFRL